MAQGKKVGMDLGKLYQILNEISFLLVKPNDETDAEIAKIDCEFIYVAVVKDKAQQHREELLAVLKGTRFLEEATPYINVGFEIGSQDAAIQLFGVGEVLGFWKVVTPSSLGASPGKSEELARQGGLMIGGLQISFL